MKPGVDVVADLTRDWLAYELDGHRALRMDG
jgi:hypothetical protein